MSAEEIRAAIFARKAKVVPIEVDINGTVLKAGIKEPTLRQRRKFQETLVKDKEGSYQPRSLWAAQMGMLIECFVDLETEKPILNRADFEGLEELPAIEESNGWLGVVAHKITEMLVPPDPKEVEKNS